MKHAAIACLDTIIEKYGKSDAESMAAAVQTVVSSEVLCHDDLRVRTMSILCLTSAVEVLSSDTIPLLPGALPRVLEQLELTLIHGERPAGLHNAGYSFLGALFVHVPWIVTAHHLDRVFKLLHKSAEAGFDEATDENRRQVLRLIATQVDAKDCFATLKRNMADAIAAGPLVCADLVLSISKQLADWISGYKRACGRSSHNSGETSKIHYC